MLAELSQAGRQSLAKSSLYSGPIVEKTMSRTASEELSKISPSCVTSQRQLAFSEPPLPRGGGGGGRACAVATSHLLANICNTGRRGRQSHGVYADFSDYLATRRHPACGPPSRQASERNPHLAHFLELNSSWDGQVEHKSRERNAHRWLVGAVWPVGSGS